MNKDVIGPLAWGGAIVVVALALSWARRHGHVDNDTVQRVVIGLTGLMLAWLGNRMPKVFVPSQRARRVHRVGGWALVLSGLAYAGLWAFAPMPVAAVAGTAAVAGGIGVTAAYAWSLRRTRPA